MASMVVAFLLRSRFHPHDTNACHPPSPRPQGVSDFHGVCPSLVRPLMKRTRASSRVTTRVRISLTTRVRGFGIKCGWVFEWGGVVCSLPVSYRCVCLAA
jgi:hypothetical protein